MLDGRIHCRRLLVLVLAHIAWSRLLENMSAISSEWEQFKTDINPRDGNVLPTFGLSQARRSLVACVLDRHPPSLVDRVSHSLSINQSVVDRVSRLLLFHPLAARL